MNNGFALYDKLIEGITPGHPITGTLQDSCWTEVETEANLGIAMTTPR